MFQKRRNVDKDGDAPIHQLNSETWGMGAYLAILEEGEDNCDRLKKLANIVISKAFMYCSANKIIINHGK